MAQLEALARTAREMVFLMRRGAGGELLDSLAASASSGSGCGGCSSGDSTGGGYTSTELNAMSLLQRQLEAANPSGGSAGAAFIGDGVAAAATRREAAGSWQQHLRTGFASALPVSGDAAQLQHRKLPLQHDGSSATGSVHPASCTVPGCRQCQYEHWRKRQAQLWERGVSSEVS